VYLEVKKRYSKKMVGRILLSENTGGGMVMLLDTLVDL
jgi:hypothetical protein